MATLTAQILIGGAEISHHGINPTHFLFLSENDRPAWILVDQNVFQEDQSSFSKITWLPTVENMLEDALLMVAIHVLKDREMLRIAKDVNIRTDAKWVEFYSNLDENSRNRLYKRCRTIPDFPKLIISVLKGSTIENQLAALDNYKMDVEVCRPI
jgi:hypothetical protein